MTTVAKKGVADSVLRPAKAQPKSTPKSAPKVQIKQKKLVTARAEPGEGRVVKAQFLSKEEQIDRNIENMKRIASSDKKSIVAFLKRAGILDSSGKVRAAS